MLRKERRMARINIEETLFKDPRFYKLAAKLGSLEAALGAFVMCLVVAQKHWLLSEKKGIPVEEWAKNQLKDEIIDVGLATACDRFVYVRGSKDSFKWLEQRSNAANKRWHPEKEDATVSDRMRPNAEAMPLSLSLLQKKETTNTSSPVDTGGPEKFDLEALYQLYPGRLGGMEKKLGMERLTKIITSQVKYEKFKKAVINFREYCVKHKKIKTEFVPMWSSFVLRWEEWVNPEFLAPKKPISFGDSY